MVTISWLYPLQRNRILPHPPPKKGLFRGKIKFYLMMRLYLWRCMMYNFIFITPRPSLTRGNGTYLSPLFGGVKQSCLKLFVFFHFARHWTEGEIKTKQKNVLMLKINSIIVFFLPQPTFNHHQHSSHQWQRYTWVVLWVHDSHHNNHNTFTTSCV